MVNLPTFQLNFLQSNDLEKEPKSKANLAATISRAWPKQMARSVRLAAGKGSRMYPMSPRVMRSYCVCACNFVCECVVLFKCVCVCYPWAKLMPFSWPRFTVGLALANTGRCGLCGVTTACAGLWSLHWARATSTVGSRRGRATRRGRG